MVTSNDEIMIVPSQAFFLQSNSTKLLLWLCLAFVICPFKVIIKLSKRGKLVLVTLSLGKQRVGEGYNKVDTCSDCNLRD